MSSSSSVSITFAGGQRVDAQIGVHAIRTDQPARMGGEDSAPSPFELFLASLGTCAGFFVQKFCTQRSLDGTAIRLTVRPAFDPEGALADIEIDIALPSAFPEKYRDAVIRVVDQCSVKRAIQAQPTFTTRVSRPDAVATDAHVP